MDHLHQYLSLPQTYNNLEGVHEFFIFTIFLVHATQGNTSKVDFPWSYWTLSFRVPHLLKLREVLEMAGSPRVFQVGEWGRPGCHCQG